MSTMKQQEEYKKNFSEKMKSRYHRRDQLYDNAKIRLGQRDFNKEDDERYIRALQENERAAKDKETQKQKRTQESRRLVSNELHNQIQTKRLQRSAIRRNELQLEEEMIRKAQESQMLEQKATEHKRHVLSNYIGQLRDQMENDREKRKAEYQMSEKERKMNIGSLKTFESQEGEPNYSLPGLSKNHDHTLRARHLDKDLQRYGAMRKSSERKASPLEERKSTRGRGSRQSVKLRRLKSENPPEAVVIIL